ncbi:hypothetical protein I3843_01G043100 [Carya illinoinensis]|nr:hypothetical protein I3843_01G043100 [Carya illinoinensis]
MQNLMISRLSSLDSMALAIKQPSNPSKPPYRASNQQKHDRPFCTYCKIQYHTLKNCFKAEKCYELHRYPLRNKFHVKHNPLGFSSANLTSVEPMAFTDERMTFTKDQYQQLLSLLPSKEVSIANHLVNNVQTNRTSSSLINAHNTAPKTSWIIDTGATDHMICSTSFFSAITSHVSFVARLPNGSTAAVSHIGIVKITNTLVLHNVLCVPSFSFNLISAKQLTNSLSCYFIFFSQNCFIQNFLSWTTIGMGEMNNGFYHLVNAEVSPPALLHQISVSLPKSFSVSNTFKSVDSISDLWH